jgi:hypothetical protein
VHCPAHDDEHPSFSISDNNGKILVKCHAGCSQDQVISALKENGLWPSGNGNGLTKGKKELVATYGYRDAAGTPLFEVCKFRNSDGSKTFSQRRPIPSGGCVWGLRAGKYQCFNNGGEWYPIGRKGINPMAVVKEFPAAQLVPYRLPELLAADPNDPVYLPEGEKDTDRLWALGVTATCNPMGAGKWRPEYNSPLNGRAVVILQDKDDAGRDHAQKVARSLHGIAASVKIVELPDLPAKGDVSDWLDAGGTIEHLQVLVELAPEFNPATAPASGAGTTATSKSKGDEEPTQQEILLTIAMAAELFHTPDDECYARIPVNGHREIWALKSKGFKRWLSYEFYKIEGKGANSESIGAALNVLEAQAQFDGAEHRVWVRVAEHEGKIYIDLANPAWEVIEITPDGWQVVAEAPVCFRRSRSMLPLTHPERNGSVNELRPFVNIASDEDFRLVIAFLLAALRARGPYPNMALNGEQGSAKSTTARGIRSLVDPNISPLRSAPREERDLMIAVTNSWMPTFDNFSGIPLWLADALCRLATGGGNSYRQLYTDGEEHIMDAMRPVAMNGISSLTERSDLADRSLIFNLPQIPEDARRPEEEFWADFERARPRILGALLDAVSMGLRNQGSVKLPALPRMADFAIWVVACEPALPWPPGSFMTAYIGNRAEAVELSLEADVVAVAVREYMADRQDWCGKPSELYEALREHISETTEKSKAWPKAPNKLSGRLKRAATFLRKVGIEIEFGHSGDRKTSIRKTKKNTVQTVQTAQSRENQGFSPDDTPKSTVQTGSSTVQEGDAGKILDDTLGAMDVTLKLGSTRKADNQAGLDDMDATDASLHTLEDDMLEVEL